MYKRLCPNYMNCHGINPDTLYPCNHAEIHRKFSNCINKPWGRPCPDCIMLVPANNILKRYARLI
jgi:hypothetical protein